MVSAWPLFALSGSAVAIGSASDGGEKTPLGKTVTGVTIPNATTPTTTETTPTVTTEDTSGTGGTEATSNTETPAVSKIHWKNLKHVKDAETVAGATHRLNTSDSTVKGDIKFIMTTKNNRDRLDHSTSRGAMNSLLKYMEYGGKPGANKLAFAVADGWDGSKANLAAAYNARFNQNASDQLPSGVSYDQARAAMLKGMTADKTAFELGTPNLGNVHNYLQQGEHVSFAGNEFVDGNDKVFTIKFADGTKLHYKLFKGDGGEWCVNVIIPFTPPKVTHTIPGTPTVSQPPVTHQKPPVTKEKPPVTDQKPPKEEEQPPETGQLVPAKPGAKHDNKTSPGGNDGRTTARLTGPARVPPNSRLRVTAP